MKKKSIFASALILTIAGVITRLLGFFYRIYMSNVIGAEGIGLYQLIMPIYMLAWSISCSGFTTTISKLTAEERARGEYGNMGRIIKQCIIITAGIGLSLSIIVFFFSDYIALNILKDERVIIPLKILSLSFPFMAAGSSIRGYFHGLQESVIPAISQVLEQSIRMVVVFALASMFIPKGLTYAAILTILGIVVGEIVSFLFMILAYRQFKTKNTLTKKPSFSTIQSLSIILTMAIPLTLNRVTSSLLSAIENTLIPQRLQLFGLTAKQSISVYGQITGMAMPLIFFPTAFLVALSISLVPAVSEAVAVKTLGKLNSLISKCLLFTSIISIGCAVLFMVFSKELGIFIFNQDISDMLFVLGFMCPFIYSQTVITGILNGLGEQIYIFKRSILSSVVSICFIFFLVPKYGIDAFIFGWFITIVFTSLSYLFKLLSLMKLKINVQKWILYPIIAALASGLTMNFFAKKYILIYFNNFFGLLVSVGILVMMYSFFIIILGCISIDDILVLFKIKKRNT